MKRLVAFVDRAVIGQIITVLNSIGARLGLTGLRAKLMIGFGTILVVVMTIFTWYQVTAQKQAAQARHMQVATDLGQIILAGLEHPMKDGAANLIQHTLEKMHALEAVESIDLINTTGVVSYSGNRANIGKHFASGPISKAFSSGLAETGFDNRQGKRIFLNAIPIINEKNCQTCHGADRKFLGILSVSLDWTSAEKMLRSSINRQVLLLIVSLILANFFLVLFLSKFVTTPLLKLIRLSDKISHGSEKITFDLNTGVKCWETNQCRQYSCVAHGNNDVMCWQIEKTECHRQHPGVKIEQAPDLKDCSKCEVYKTNVPDEMVHLMYSFRHMLSRITASEKDLKQSEEKYRKLFDSVPTSVFILDRKTLAILDANARSLQCYGYSKEELLKLNFSEFGDEDQAKMIYQAFEDVNNHRHLFPREKHRRSNGNGFYVSIDICDAIYMGQAVLIATTTDITDSVQKEIQLIQTSKMATLGEMAAGMAHEMNQPLSAIGYGSDFLTDQIEEGHQIDYEDLKMVSEEISAQVKRAAAIITHMREFSRIADEDLQDVNMNTAVEAAHRMLEARFKLQKIKVEMALAPKLPPIKADKNRIEQVLINLLNNARHAMLNGSSDAKRELGIRSFLDGAEVGVAISDTGHGIPEDIIDKIFEPFFTTKEVGQGTGLGLSISYGIVEDYNGSMTVQSEPGSGTVFELRFPATTAARI